ncbi:sigma-70 family RNA polymerase sigma factor [Candidatus Solirubrobacter pratensis]|uniref:sigma-70 family RNA polymerase sigma factor n=1 Tax=Candidatus Solirubrobacter pratensis TaxID=1298857 RepID=UPI0018CBCA1E|nr:sigma-70 family RNA polymerase sigma factor [Candidatus Solirubrobacter pratensis]
MVFRQRSEAAFESLYQRHVREVYGYALAVLGTPADAEDVTQTTFMNAYRAFQRGERPDKPRSWLFAIAHNVCRQRFRQAARRPREVELHEAVADVEETDAPTAQDIARALQSLPFNQRSALVMRELEGRKQSEIAEALGVSVSAVETLLFRARRGVREQLETSLTCGEAERAISRQLDGASSRSERAALRAHLRSCEECATFARRARAHRGALRRLSVLPLPASLLSWSGGAGGGAAVAAAPTAAGLGVKLLAGTAAVAIAAGAGDQALKRHHRPAAVPAPTVPAVTRPAATPANVSAPPSATISVTARERLARSPGHRRAVAKAAPPKALGRGHAKAPKSSSHGRALGHAKATKPRGHGRALGHAKGSAAKPHNTQRPPQGKAKRDTGGQGSGPAKKPHAAKKSTPAPPVTAEGTHGNGNHGKNK